MILNKRLLFVLTILFLVIGVSSVCAYSDEGSGSINGSSSGDNYTDSDDVSPDVVYEEEDDGNGGSSHVSLKKYATANPVLLLIVSLLCVGFLSRRF